MLLLKWIAALVITAAGAMFTWTSLLPHTPNPRHRRQSRLRPRRRRSRKAEASRSAHESGKDQAQDGGSIIAQVVRPDGTAARDMGVCLVREDVAQVGLTAREAAIGDDGTCRFDGLAPGRYCVTLNPDRQSRTVIVAGAGEQAVTLSADQGYHVDGMVVDDQGQAVAGALVWVGGYPPLDESGQVVTTAASDGSFHLDGLMETAMIAARKPGMSPSPAQCLLWLVKQKATPIAINLVLGAASGAVQRWSMPPAPPSPARWSRWDGRARTCRTACSRRPRAACWRHAHGEFCVPGLAAGTTDVRAGAIGCAVARVAVDVVAGETTQAVLTLSAGATLCGRVTADGSPWPGSITVDFRRGYPLTCAQAAANVNGEYRLEHLAEGEFQAIASIGGAQTATIELTAHGTETLTWSPAFTTSTMIAGRLLDARDVPLAGWRLSAIPDAGVRVVVDAITDAQGRFTMPRVGTGEHVLMVHGRLPPDGSISMAFAMLVEHVRPSSNDVVIHFAEPSAWIKGTLATPEGDAPDTAITEITASMREFPAMITRADAESGEFALGPLGAGTYHVSAGAVGFESQDLGRLTLAADQTIDVGVLVLKRR
ncbi:MAG: carboxypeptidase-like regulatory domain-containing protein [Planctomycetota bacterium]